MNPGAVQVLPYNLAAIVDPEGRGRAGAGDIDGGDATGGVEEEAMVPRATRVPPNDLAAIVDPQGRGARHIDGGKAAARIQEAMGAERIAENPYNLAAIVDPVGKVYGRRRENGSW